MTDRLIDIARRVDESGVRMALRDAYPDLSKSGIESHIDALHALRAKEPTDPEGFTIRLSSHSEDGEAWIHVDAMKEGDPQAYSLSASPWALWAALPIRVVGLDMTEAQVIAHILWEMTFHGDEDETKEFFDGLREQIDDLGLDDDEEPSDD